MFNRNYKRKEGVSQTLETIALENGYFIEINKEPIAKKGPNIFRAMDDSQIVMKIIHPTGKVTNRFAIPAQCAGKVAETIAL